MYLGRMALMNLESIEKSGEYWEQCGHRIEFMLKEERYKTSSNAKSHEFAVDIEWRGREERTTWSDGRPRRTPCALRVTLSHVCPHHCMLNTWTYKNRWVHFRSET